MKAVTGILLIVGILSIIAGIVAKFGGLDIPISAKPLAAVVFGNSCILVALALNALKK